MNDVMMAKAVMLWCLFNPINSTLPEKDQPGGGIWAVCGHGSSQEWSSHQLRCAAAVYTHHCPPGEPQMEEDGLCFFHGDPFS